MRTQTVNIYSFEELPEQQQQAVIDKQYDINTDYYWSEVELWDFSDHLKSLGFDVESKDIQFSGFSSQGDGASFTGNVDVEQFINSFNYKNEFRFLTWAIHQELIDVSVNLYRTGHHYSHKYTVSTSVNYDIYTDMLHDKTERRIELLLESQLEKLEQYIESERIKLCSDLYESLRDQYNYLTSDEAIKETLIENEYEFYSNGDLV